MKAINALLVVSVVVGVGCASTSEPPTSTAASLTLAPVAWNPSNVDVGSVQAVAEQDTSVVLFGSKGVQLLTGGALVSSDETITSWRSAAVIPSADGLSSWMVGVDDAGHIQRIRDEAAPDDVSDSYGLTADKVKDLVAGTNRVAFLLEGTNGLAVTDGANVTRYPGPALAVAANATRVALADAIAVRVLETNETDAKLTGAQLVAFDASGTLMAATEHALYRISGGAAEKVWDAGARTIHQLVGAGQNVWLSVDHDLAVWQNGHVAIASGSAVADGSRIVGSTSGDIWVLANGQVQRWSAQVSAGGDEGTWNATVQPIYAAVCSNCHSPPGSGKDSSHIDLSTHAGWNARRALVYNRVVAQAGSPSAMPPPTSSYVLTAAQRSAIEAWSKP